ncbi:phosphoinositide 3-kinase adapter protein 1 [Genypterus blacodes]|uniref:phosphoinositide 3-kinase adapter protein 1 n=1 Tax=Genypterus blacodes TaxID=154954 RepID=UPI003F770A56
MEEVVSTSESATSESLSAHELLILHTAEAQEWATYLQSILKSSRKFRKRSILLYSVGPADQLHGYDFNCFQSCKCIVLLLTGAFLEILCDPELQGSLQRLLHPPHRVVALLCGISEDDALVGNFEDWPSWRKLCAEDEPALYISTIMKSINDSEHRHKSEVRPVEAEGESEAAVVEELHVLQISPNENPKADEQQEGNSEADEQTVTTEEENVSEENLATEETSSPACLTCLTAQPSRILCGSQETIFFIFAQKLDDQSVPEVEFASENAAPKKVSGTLENEYTLTVTAPDMPAGRVSLTLHTEHESYVSLMPVTYYTHMGEVSWHLERAADPVEFLCQAFKLTSNTRESLDNMLTDSFKSRIPAEGLQVFGNKQIEEDNMAAYERDEELPTLLHFAAKYGLKKLTTILLQCPGAVQAYSVMNKHGDYPNTLAQKSGFSDLKLFMDRFLAMADTVTPHLKDGIETEPCRDVYEDMLASSQDSRMNYEDYTEEIYESMLEIDPECAEDLYEVMTAVEDDQIPAEVMLRKFFQGKPHTCPSEDNEPHVIKEEEEMREHRSDLEDYAEEEEDPYNICPDDIYDIVQTNTANSSAVFNRPPAPVPRSEMEPPEPENKTSTYISRVFSDKVNPPSRLLPLGPPPGCQVRPATNMSPAAVYDPYAGMKTPGQRQLISLQERVKVGDITVEEAVQEFKVWQFDHQQRASSIRIQKDNLKSLRDSITRRHKERGKDLEYEISAPLPRNSSWGSVVECSVYEPTPRNVSLPPPVARPIQRGSWKTGSTSSTSSTESNRLSTHSTFSYSSGTEPEFEDILESGIPPSRPMRPSDAAPNIPPPRIPPRLPERVPEKMLHERYISCPQRALPQRPSSNRANSPPPLPPPIPRRLR